MDITNSPDASMENSTYIDIFYDSSPTTLSPPQVVAPYVSIVVYVFIPLILLILYVALKLLKRASLIDSRTELSVLETAEAMRPLRHRYAEAMHPRPIRQCQVH